MASSPTNSDTSASASPSVARHRNSDFYLDTKVFLVEDELFRIPTKYFAENSVVFRDMLSLPQTEESAEGITDEKPIVLEGIKKADFGALLKVIFHFGPISKFADQGHGLTDEQWLSLLSLSNMWELVEIRDAAITALDQIMKALNLREIEWVLRGRRYLVPEWVEYGYCRLAKRHKLPVSVTEAEELGVESALKLAGIQGRVHARHNPLKGSWCRAESTEIAKAVIEDVQSVFAKELQAVTYSTRSTENIAPALISGKDEPDLEMPML